MKTFLSPFTPEQENECLKKIKEGDLEAKKELILRNMRLVAHVAKKYQNSDEDMEDLISIGTIGLIKAVGSFDVNKGSRLATYAARCIDNELLMLLRSKKKTSREISLYEPIGTIGLIKAISTYKENYGNRLATYAARCIDNELLMHFRAKKKTSREVSLYEPIGTDKEGNQINLLDIVESDEPDIVEKIEIDRRTAQMLELVPKVLEQREYYIIEKRYGLYGSKPMTQREIASALEISRSYVSRIEKRALEKLRKNLGECGQEG